MRKFLEFGSTKRSVCDATDGDIPANNQGNLAC